MKDISNFRLICLRCSHTWIPRKGEVKRCAKCKTPYWNKKKEKVGK